MSGPLGLNLLHSFAEVVDLREVEDLILLVVRQMATSEDLEALRRRNWVLDLLVVRIAAALLLLRGLLVYGGELGAGAVRRGLIYVHRDLGVGSSILCALARRLL